MNDRIKEVALRVAREMRKQSGFEVLDLVCNAEDFLTRCLQELNITEQDKRDTEEIRRNQANASLTWAADLAEKMGNAEIAEMIRLGASE